VSELVAIEQSRAGAGAVPWILDMRGRRTPGHDDERRLAEVQAGLARHPDVRVRTADVGAEEVQRILSRLHDPDYLRALRGVRGRDPVLIDELAQPGLRPDTPVCAEAVASAREGVGVAITAAQCILAGARFSYALCRPPGHHAGPDWLGGYCYLNNAAAAAQTLSDGGLGRVGILDLDLHYPNGTSALVERMTQTTLCSLHGATGANLPWRQVLARTEREHLRSFRSPPAQEAYLAELATFTDMLTHSTDAIVLSLGYDIVKDDPHGAWSFQASIFEQIGRLLAGSRLPVCVVQEGGYALESLAQCSYEFATGLLEGSER
jgi:acetoin utilization deacetylase AcuC-like enzyme